MAAVSRPVLLYDQSCRFCRWTARVVLRLDRRQELAVLPLDDPEAAELLEPIHEAERDDSWRLALTNGNVVGRGQGVVELAQALRLTRPLASLLSRVPKPALDTLYRVLARGRGRFSSLVPDGPAPRRFP